MRWNTRSRYAEGGTSTAVGSLEEGQMAYIPENEGRGFDFVKFAEACGAAGERVTDPNEIKDALKRGVESGIPYVIDIILERDTDCSMGVSIDAIREFE
jgi:tartronate-semialdehyde synthase